MKVIEPITDARLDELRSLADAATPEPWGCVNDSLSVKARGVTAVIVRRGGGWVWEQQEKNSQFIAAARDAVPELIAEVRRLLAELSERPSPVPVAPNAVRTLRAALERAIGVVETETNDDQLVIELRAALAATPGAEFAQDVALRYAEAGARAMYDKVRDILVEVNEWTEFDEYVSVTARNDIDPAAVAREAVGAMRSSETTPKQNKADIARDILWRLTGETGGGE